MEAIRHIIEHVMEMHKVPGFALAIARGSEASTYLVLGTDRDGIPLSQNSLFPVASITKLATALTVLRLVDSGQLTLDAPLARYIPESTVALDGVTVHTLLTHTSGLPNSHDETNAQWSESLTWHDIAQASIQTAPIAPPNTKVIYSNVGYSLLAVIIERLSGQPFKATLRQLVIEPLGIEAYLGDEPPHRVATVFDAGENPARIGTPLEWRNSTLFRSLATPYGGMVTSLNGAFGLLHVFSGKPVGFLRPEIIGEATRNQTGKMDGMVGPFKWSPCPWGLGPELRGIKTPHWIPPDASPNSFGHAGTSGCVVWTDPRRDITWTIMCTRAMDGDWFLPAFTEIGATILRAE
jgi:CubicO group peptidase (beta-lactamase class C family)